MKPDFFLVFYCSPFSVQAQHQVSEKVNGQSILKPMFTCKAAMRTLQPTSLLNFPIHTSIFEEQTLMISYLSFEQLAGAYR